MSWHTLTHGTLTHMSHTHSWHTHSHVMTHTHSWHTHSHVMTHIHSWHTNSHVMTHTHSWHTHSHVMTHIHSWHTHSHVMAHTHLHGMTHTHSWHTHSHDMTHTHLHGMTLTHSWHTHTHSHDITHSTTHWSPFMTTCHYTDGLCLTAIFPHEPGLVVSLELRLMEVVVTTAAIKRAKLQSKCHHQQTYAIVGPIVWWNSLPDSLRDPAVGPDQFRRDLKTHLFVWHCVSFSTLAVFSRNALYKSTFYLLTYLLTQLFYRPDALPVAQPTVLKTDVIMYRCVQSQYNSPVQGLSD